MINHEAKTPVGHPESIDMRRPETHPRPPIDRSTGAGHQKKIWREEKRARARALSRPQGFVLLLQVLLFNQSKQMVCRSKDTGRDAISKSSRIRSNKKTSGLCENIFRPENLSAKKPENSGITIRRVWKSTPAYQSINKRIKVETCPQLRGRLAERVTT